jgi:hypothetical protein
LEVVMDNLPEKRPRRAGKELIDLSDGLRARLSTDDVAMMFAYADLMVEWEVDPEIDIDPGRFIRRWRS